MELRMEVEIEAPAQRIWEVLTDFTAHAQWNPFVTAISGRLAIAARLDVTYSFPDGSETRLVPEIVVLHPPRELRWRSHVLLASLLTIEHYFVLGETGRNRTRFAQGEHLSGFGVKYFGKRHTAVARGMVAMNQALKRLVEG
jgi:hypothetical protein